VAKKKKTIENYSKREHKKELFLKAYRESLGNISKACEMAKVRRNTYYDWIKNDPGFREKVMEVDESFLDLAESVLLKKIRKEDLKAVIYFLDTRGKSRGYGKSIKVNGDIKTNSNVVVEGTLTYEQIKRIEKEAEEELKKEQELKSNSKDKDDFE